MLAFLEPITNLTTREEVPATFDPQSMRARQTVTVGVDRLNDAAETAAEGGRFNNAAEAAAEVGRLIQILHDFHGIYHCCAMTLPLALSHKGTASDYETWK